LRKDQKILNKSKKRKERLVTKTMSHLGVLTLQTNKLTHTHTHKHALTFHKKIIIASKQTKKGQGGRFGRGNTMNVLKKNKRKTRKGQFNHVTVVILKQKRVINLEKLKKI
jgi:hypothetical protein